VGLFRNLGGFGCELAGILPRKIHVRKVRNNRESNLLVKCGRHSQAIASLPILFVKLCRSNTLFLSAIEQN
jgi:hypothetical protein